MGFRPNQELDANNMKPGLGQYVDPGFYHVEITDVIEKPDGDKPETVFELTVRDGTVNEMINRVHRDKRAWYNTQYPNLEKQNQEMICLFAIQAGITTKEAIASQLASGEEVVFNWRDAIGKHVIVEIEKNQSKKNDKIYHQVKTGQIFTLDDPIVANVPRNMEAAALAGAAEVF